MEARLLAALWVAMMVAWMVGLVLGVWGIWPLLQRPSLDLAIPLAWLIIGTIAWIVALNFGLQRFRRR